MLVTKIIDSKSMFELVAYENCNNEFYIAINDPEDHQMPRWVVLDLKEAQWLRDQLNDYIVNSMEDDK